MLEIIAVVVMLLRLIRGRSL